MNGAELLHRDTAVRNSVAITSDLSQVNLEAQCQEAMNLFKGNCNLTYGPEDFPNSNR